MLTLEQQAAFVEEAPEIFLPIPGGFGRMGHTYIRLTAASEDVLAGALQAAWKLRMDMNAKTTRNKKARGLGEDVDRFWTHMKEKEFSPARPYKIRTDTSCHLPNQSTKTFRFIHYLDELLKPENQEITWTS